VIVAGSGPTDRDWNTPLLGKLSMQSHLDELASAVETLASQSNVRRDRVYAVANERERSTGSGINSKHLRFRSLDSC
jgi:hypothetical protein